MSLDKNSHILDMGLLTYCMTYDRLFRTKAGMTSAAESITDSLRRTRQLMVQVSSSVSSCFLL